MGRVGSMERRDWLLLSVITLFAAIVRVVSVNFPSRTVVDEFWYARDGCYYWLREAQQCGLANLITDDRDAATWLATFGELTPEHPPLAKWLIGAPMSLLGYGPGAWRLAAVAAGVLTVALLYLLAKRALGSTTAASGASGLLAIDFPHLIHSRTAMLEIFLALFAVAAFYFCVLDRTQSLRRVAGLPSHRGWRLAAGVAGGAAAACKLSGVAIVVGVLLLAVVGETITYRRFRRRARQFLSEALWLALLLVVVPVASYLATYAGRLNGTLLTAPWADDSWVRAWLERQSYMLEIHGAKPSISTPPWTLPMTEEPLVYFHELSAGVVREVLLFGNPLLWWLGFVAVAYAAMRMLRGDRSLTTALVVVAFLASYAGWLSITLTGRPVWLFYAVPIAPFLYLALAYVAMPIRVSRAGRTVAGAVTMIAILAFAFYLPIVTGLPLQTSDWQARACSAQVLWLQPIDACQLRQ